MSYDDFKATWNEIVKHQGEKYYTKKKIEFAYNIPGNVFRTNRTDYIIQKSNFLKAYKLIPLTGPG